MLQSAFPILTFDEWTLAPSLGYVFNPACLGPHESLVSMLWKFAWANRLPGHIVVSHAAKSTIDPYDGITASLEDINAKRVASTLHITHFACPRTDPILAGSGVTIFDSVLAAWRVDITRVS